jgi:hypothetical protein
MQYTGVGAVGTGVTIPAEWAPVISKAREFSLAGKIAFLRVVSSFNHSMAQHAAGALGPDIATPLVPTASSEARVAMIVRWLGSAEFTSEEKDGMIAAWRLLDRTTRQRGGIASNGVGLWQGCFRQPYRAHRGWRR